MNRRASSPGELARLSFMRLSVKRVLSWPRRVRCGMSAAAVRVGYGRTQPPRPAAGGYNRFNGCARRAQSSERISEVLSHSLSGRQTRRASR